MIAGEVLGYLREGGDEVARRDAVRSLCDLAERYAPDHQWFVDTMNELFEVAGAITEPAGLTLRSCCWGSVRHDQVLPGMADACTRLHSVALGLHAAAARPHALGRQGVMAVAPVARCACRPLACAQARWCLPTWRTT